MQKLFFALISAVAAIAATADPNFPLGTYVYAGTAMNYRNEALTSADGVRIQAVSTNGTVLASAAVVDAPSESGVNFRLEVPVSTFASGKSAAIGDAPRCVIVTSAGSRGAATETFPPILCASAVTNCVVVWSDAVAFTNSADTSMVALVPQDYLQGISFLMEENGKASYEPWADWDGDGANNYAEYAAGTNPFDPSDLLRVTAFSATRDATVLSFEYVGGHLYGLKSAKELSNPEWATTEFKTSETAGRQKALYAAGEEDVGVATLYVAPAANEPQMFYRVEVK